MLTFLKSRLIYGTSWDRGRFMKNFRFDKIYKLLRNHSNYRELIVAAGSTASVL